MIENKHDEKHILIELIFMSIDCTSGIQSVVQNYWGSLK